MPDPDIVNAVAEMVATMGYEPFIWDAEFFNKTYKIVQVNPIGTWIVIHEGCMIEVDAQFNSNTWCVDGGIMLDMSDPKSTEQRLIDVVKGAD